MEFFKKEEKTIAQEYETAMPIIHKQMSPEDLRALMGSQKGCNDKSFAIRESSAKGRITVDTFLDHIAKDGKKIPGQASYRFAFVKGKGWEPEDPSKPHQYSSITPMTRESAEGYLDQL